VTSAAASWNDFWFAPAPASTLAVVRIAVGGLSLLGGLVLWPDLDPLYYATPLGTAGARAVTLVLVSSAIGVVVGLRTRLTSMALVLALVTLAHVNPFIFNSGDTLLRHLALIVALAPSGAALSLDARRRVGTAWHFPDRPAWPLRLIQLQVAVMYAAAVAHKLGGETWRDGTAAAYPLSIPDVTRFAVATPLAEWAVAARIFTWGTLAIEAAIPLCVWNRRLRPWVLLTGAALHLGIDLTLRAGLFSWVVLASYVAFVPPATMAGWLSGMRLRRRRIATVALTVIFAALGCRTERLAVGPGTTPEEFLGWLQRRPADVGLAIVSPTDPSTDVFHQADEIFPLASARKILVLGAYADAVAAGVLDPDQKVPYADVERWYWRGTDGDAHPAAAADLEARGVIDATAVPVSVRLDDVVFSAMRWSDNAAADYLLDRVGKRAVDDFIHRHRLERQEPIAPILGELLAWTETSPPAWRALTPVQRAERAWRRASVLTGEEAQRDRRLPSSAVQRELADVSFGGTPREWARFIVDLFARETDDRAASVLRRHLEWPMTVFPANATRFRRFAGKAGAVAGVRTEVVYLQPTSRPPRAAVLFLRHVDPAAETALSVSFVDQGFLVRVAEDEDFLSTVRAAWPPPTG
jgi:hypothetical protein